MKSTSQRLKEIRQKKTGKPKVGLWIFSVLFIVISGISGTIYRDFYRQPQKIVVYIYPISKTISPTPTDVPEAQVPTKTLAVENTRTPTKTPIVIHVATGVDDGNLNLRAMPTTNSRILSILNEGESMKFIMCEDGGWIRVEYKGWVGFVYSRYIAERICE